MMSKQLEEAVWQREVAEQRLARTKTERDELEENFMAAILNGSRLNLDAGTNSSGETIVI